MPPSVSTCECLKLYYHCYMSARYDTDIHTSIEDELNYTMRSVVRGDGRTTSVMHAILTGDYPGRPIEEIAFLVAHTPEQINPVLRTLKDAGWLRTEVTIEGGRQVDLYSLALPPTKSS